MKMSYKSALGFALVGYLAAGSMFAQLSRVGREAFTPGAIQLHFGVQGSAFTLPDGAEARDVLSKWGLVFYGIDLTVPKIEVRVIDQPFLGPPVTVWALRNSGSPNGNRPLVVDFEFPVRRIGFNLGIRDIAIVVLTAYDLEGRLLGRIEAGQFSSDPTFVGVETSSAEGIAKVVIDYGNNDVGEQIRDLLLEYVPAGPRFTIFLPQVADGVIRPGAISGATALQTVITVVNVGSMTAKAIVFFFDSNGQPLSVELDGTTGSRFDLVLGVGNSRTFATPGTSSPLKVGYARIESDLPLEATAVFATLDSQKRVLIEAGISATAAVVRAVGGVERQAAGGVDSGIALVNTSEQATKVTIELSGENGAPYIMTSLQLGPRAHIARFLRELFPFLEQNFRGTLQIQSPEPLASVIVRTRDGLAVSGLPVGTTEK